MAESVVVLIIVHKERLDWFEEIALQQCFRILGNHPIRLVCPVGLELDAYRAIAPKLVPDFIPASCLSSYRAFNRTKILPFLYRRYAKYDFILFYELDAFVFRDDLLHWCERDWDYVGAPWFAGYHEATLGAHPSGVGNGGFSLRRTKAMLRVSRSLRYQRPPRHVIGAWRRGHFSLAETVKSLTVRNNFFAPFNDYYGNEDLFWGDLAAKRFPGLRVAPYESARQFSFEVNPSRLFEECGSSLPFGCHKWMIYEPDFWREHIRRFGYDLPTIDPGTSGIRSRFDA